MSGTSDSTTSLSLLMRLRTSPDDAATWDEFVARYGRLIERWCRNWGLQDADAMDVTQNVLLALSKQMRSFEYRADGRFRSWLKTVAYRAWAQFLEKRRRNVVHAAQGEAVLSLLESTEARDSFLNELDRECERNMLEDAMQLVERRVQPHTWQAFKRTTFGDEVAAQVGADLSMSVLAVYRAKSRVQAMIQQEIELMEQSDLAKGD